MAITKSFMISRDIGQMKYGGTLKLSMEIFGEIKFSTVEGRGNVNCTSPHRAFCGQSWFSPQNIHPAYAQNPPTTILVYMYSTIGKLLGGHFASIFGSPQIFGATSTGTSLLELSFMQLLQFIMRNGIRVSVRDFAIGRFGVGDYFSWTLGGTSWKACTCGHRHTDYKP
ncbi:hypothetical protein L1049_009430 [Liquidambar formosana]|uniref:Uncharacterized protein n=1 Tax=Liquidambar formosana TaxID=63359 RepID=A0AAP0SAZ7_LIQFO